MLGMGKALGQSSGAMQKSCSVLFLPLVLQSPAELSSLLLGRQLNKFRQLSASPSTCGLRLPRVTVTRGGWSQKR